MKQPEGSKLCGHVCLALILGIELPDAVDLVGHTKGTKTKELVKHFTGNPIKKGHPNVYSLCKCRPHDRKCKGDWHWVVYLNDEIYDPVYGFWINFNNWAETTKLKISSYIEIIPPI